MASTMTEDSIIHRVKILNLPAHEMGSIKKFLQSLDFHKYKKAPKWDYAFMNFEVIKSPLIKPFFSHVFFVRLRKRLDKQ